MKNGGFKKIGGFLTNKFASNTIYLLFEKIVRLIGSFIIFSEIAKYLGPSQFGLYNYSLAIFAVLLTITNYGIHGLLVKHLCLFDKKEANRYLGSAFLLKFLIGLFCFVFILCFYPVLFDSPLKGKLTSIICIGLIFHSFSVIECWFEANVQNKIISIIKTIFFIFYLFIIIGAIQVNISLITLCYLYVLEMVLRSIALIISYQKSGRNIFHFTADLKIIKDLIKNGLPLLLSSIAGVIYLKIDQVMIGEMLNNVELGYYSGAVRFSEAIYFIPWITTNALFPLIIQKRALGKKNYLKEFRKLSSFFFYTSLLISLFIYCISYYLVWFFLGENYLESVAVIKIHAWSIVFISLRALVNKWFILEGMYNKLFVLELIGGSLNIILNLYFIPQLGIIGAAITSLISYSLISYFGLLFFKDSRRVFYIFTTCILNPYHFITYKLKNRD